MSGKHNGRRGGSARSRGSRRARAASSASRRLEAVSAGARPAARSDRNRQQLYEIAKDKDIPGRSKMGKWDLIKAIRKRR